ncbi:ABC transporter substrate-binding protein [Clostridium massiliamazoniense]|uniref:ABC transporter substrate-binding protein n=1 Tax=Clostridium massiliamazoniense TaxID=1347366 RepID=UPI0006D7B1E7|nr:extracellular solute-binding protein [Clostridium massiliamazoniense]
MKRFQNLFKVIVIAMSTITLVSCSNLRVKKEEEKDNKEKVEASKEEEITLNLWTHFPGFEAIAEAFEKENPNININIKNFDYDEYELEYKKSLVEDIGQADILAIDSNHYGEFNSIKGLEDLLKPEYTAINYKEDFDPELWELGKSMDKSKLLGIPIGSAPIVTYYRADILEKYGFPTEPKELAEYMKDKNNWVKIGETLKKDGISIVQWVAEIVKIYSADMPYFNEKLEYQRDNEKFKEGIAVAREAMEKGFSPFADIWSEKGKQLLRDGKFAMLYLGSWGARDLEALVPEQKGKWRVTSLPFGVYGWNNSSILSIAENSKNKQAAWKFIEYCTFKYNDKNRIGTVSSYLPFRNNESAFSQKNEFLGGQEEQKFYEDIMELTKEYPVTALDNEAFKLWDDLVNIGLEEEYSDDKIMENIRTKVASLFAKEKESLLKEK